MKDAQAADVIVGRIVGTFGTRGELKIAAADREIFRPGMRLSLQPRAHATASDASAASPTRAAIIESVRLHKNVVVARLQGVNDASEAATLRGAAIIVGRDALPALEPATFREIDLIGMQVTDARLGPLGLVQEVLRYPEYEMLVVGDGRMLVPMLNAYGMTVDVGSRQIRTALPEGFEDLR